MNRTFWKFPPFLCLSAFALTLLLHTAPAQCQEYHRVNLVSDIPGVALRSDPHLVNPWGIAFSETSPVWIADNGTGTSTLYLGDGTPAPNPAAPLVVTVPGASAGAQSAPTGLVLNSTPSFVVAANGKAGASVFIFATEDGTISGWNPTVDLHNAIPKVNNSTSGAVYKGLGTGVSGGKDFLYVTNFHDGVVEMYDASFQFVKSFTDSSVPMGYAPFGIRNINGELYVTFALQNAQKHDDVSGPGNGFIDVFSTDGVWQSRFASQGALNSPWGLALAPGGFGTASRHLLVGNFGDGHISVFDFPGGAFVGQLHDTLGAPIAINGLWGLSFASGGPSGKKNHLLFTAGIGDEGHGLFGFIRPGNGGEDHGNNDE
jgi:uncharacterized protein (TIGR03118 family)